MFRFSHKEYLLALLIIPVLAGLMVLFAVLKKRDLKKFGNPEVISSLMPDISGFRYYLKYIIVLVALTLLIFAMAGPQFGSKLVEVKKKGIDIIIALDVSNSMLAQDIKPNRLERAKQELSKLIDKLQNDRLGLIVFAGDAYTQIPITNDYLSAKMFLTGINVNMVSRQGTDIASAIRLAMKSFGPETAASKAIVIISDGENFEGDVMQTAKEAAEKGIKIYTIGMGLPNGAPIPVSVNSSVNDYRKDREGNIIFTKLDEHTLAAIAEVGGGKYYRASMLGMGMGDMLSSLNRLNKTEMESKEYSDYAEQFPVLVWIALGLLMIDFLVLQRKNKWLKNIQLFN